MKPIPLKAGDISENITECINIAPSEGDLMVAGSTYGFSYGARDFLPRKLTDRFYIVILLPHLVYIVL